MDMPPQVHPVLSSGLGLGSGLWGLRIWEVSQGKILISSYYEREGQITGLFGAFGPGRVHDSYRGLNPIKKFWLSDELKPNL
jgi:hypothetical protein